MIDHTQQSDPSSELNDPSATDDGNARNTSTMDAELHHAHPKHTGHRWLDISLSLCAFAVSLISLWIAVHHGKTMERLVASNSYPNVDVENGNSYQDGKEFVFLKLNNTGVGPARLRTVAISFDGKPVRTLHEMLKQCCDLDEGDLVQYFKSGDVRGAMIPAGRGIELFRWVRTDEISGLYGLFSAAQGKITIDLCYCSVFNECYRSANGQREPESVESCPIQKPDTAWLGSQAP
jgi:hypothetical protein